MMNSILILNLCAIILTATTVVHATPKKDEQKNHSPVSSARLAEIHESLAAIRTENPKRGKFYEDILVNIEVYNHYLQVLTQEEMSNRFLKYYGKLKPGPSGKVCDASVSKAFQEKFERAIVLLRNPPMKKVFDEVN